MTYYMKDGVDGSFKIQKLSGGLYVKVTNTVFEIGDSTGVLFQVQRGSGNETALYLVNAQGEATYVKTNDAQNAVAVSATLP